MRSWLGWGRDSTGSKGNAGGGWGASDQNGEHSGSGICVIRACVRIGGRAMGGAGQRAGSISQGGLRGGVQPLRKSGVNHNGEGGQEF